MSINPTTMVLVDFSGDLVHPGPAHLLVRFNYDDLEVIKIAGSILGMKQAEFARMALVKSALKVISENK